MSNVLPRREVRGAADLAGKYRLIAELGQGGMATVYLAVAMGTSGFRKLAVVKLLRPEIAVDQEFVEMFLDEAKLCARLSHPNIVHTYDVGVDEFGHLMAMEYLDGVSFHAAIAKLARTGEALSFTTQARVLLDVLEGLRYAHELKDYDGRSLEIVHRDVTPHNIFVTFDGQVKLLDFGIAKAATSSVRTATGVIKGKLTYMAPEQARGEGVDARADLYAVGVMLWEAMTGRRRWPAGLSQPALFTRLASGEPPESPASASHGYPAEIDDIILRTLAVKPQDRYQTAGELRAALESVMGRLEPVSLRDLGTTLSTAFAEGRRRIRDVIEEQFRAIDSGAHPSEPHQLPAVAPPGIATKSEAIERLSPVAPTEKIDSASIRLTALETAPKPRPKTRLPQSAIAIAAAAIAAAGVAIAVAAAHGRPGTTAGPVGTGRLASDPGNDGPPIIAPTGEPGGSGVGRPDNPATTNPVASDSARRADLRGRPLSPALSGAVRAAGPRPAVSAREAPSSSSAVVTTPPAPSESATSEGVPLHRPESKPRVQLERDNPWP